MLLGWMALLIFFGFRAYSYFSKGRAFAGTFACMACLLFVGAIYADFARTPRIPSAATADY